MDIIAKLTEEMKTAMKSGQKDRLTVIRMLLSEAKNADLQPNKPAPITMVEAYAKKLRKSAEEWEKLGKADEVAKLKTELTIVEEFLPKKLSPEETSKLVDEFLAKNTFTEKEIGKATGMFMKANGSNVDAGVANGLIKGKLAGK